MMVEHKIQSHKVPIQLIVMVCVVTLLTIKGFDSVLGKVGLKAGYLVGEDWEGGGAGGVAKCLRLKAWRRSLRILHICLPFGGGYFKPQNSWRTNSTSQTCVEESEQSEGFFLYHSTRIWDHPITLTAWRVRTARRTCTIKNPNIFTEFAATRCDDVFI